MDGPTDVIHVHPNHPDYYDSDDYWFEQADLALEAAHEAFDHAQNGVTSPADSIDYWAKWPNPEATQDTVDLGQEADSSLQEQLGERLQHLETDLEILQALVAGAHRAVDRALGPRTDDAPPALVLDAEYQPWERGLQQLEIAYRSAAATLDRWAGAVESIEWQQITVVWDVVSDLVNRVREEAPRLGVPLAQYIAPLQNHLQDVTAQAARMVSDLALQLAARLEREAPGVPDVQALPVAPAQLAGPGQDPAAVKPPAGSGPEPASPVAASSVAQAAPTPGRPATFGGMDVLRLAGRLRARTPVSGVTGAAAPRPPQMSPPPPRPPRL